MAATQSAAGVEYGAPGAKIRHRLRRDLDLFDILPEEALIGFRAVCAIRGRSPASTWRDVTHGRLARPIHIGGSALFRVGDVRASLRERQRVVLSATTTSVERQAAAQAAYPAEMARRIWGADVQQQIADVLAKFILKHSQQYANQQQAALHEAGHFVAFEVDQMGPCEASIRGTPGGRGGWGGVTSAWRRPYITLGSYKADDLLREARTVLAGPLAEELLGDGDSLSSIGELFESHLLTSPPADLKGVDRRTVLADTVAAAAKIVETHEESIREIASMLMRTRRVTTNSCEYVLRRVESTKTHDGPMWWPRSKELAQLIVSLPHGADHRRAR